MRYYEFNTKRSENKGGSGGRISIHVEEAWKFKGAMSALAGRSNGSAGTVHITAPYIRRLVVSRSPRNYTPVH